MPSSSIQVLVVDDEPALCALTKQFLEMSSDLCVDTAGSVREAMNKLAEKRYGAIVSDYQMPEDDGIQFLKSLRAAGDRTSFILFTGRGREEVAIEALNNGADSYLQKGGDPVSQYAELGHRIRLLMQQHEAEESLKRQSGTLAILNDIISKANQADGLPHLLDSILEGSLRLLDFDAGGIYLVDRSKRTADVVCSKNMPPELLLKVQTVSIDEKPYDTLFIHNEPIITENYAQINLELSKRFGFRSMASIPLISKGVTIGALNITSTRRHVISVEDKQTLISISRELGITIERMMAEEESRKAALNLKTLFNSIDEMLFVMDMQGLILEVNDAVQKRLLYAPGELIDSNFLMLHEPERRDEVLRTFQGMIAGTIDSCHILVLAKDGTRIEVETKVTRGWWNNQEVLIGVTRDVSERKRVEEALHQSEEKHRLLIENSHDIIYTITKDGTFTFVSPSWTLFLGHPVDQVVGIPFQSFVHEDDLAECTEFLQRAIETGQRQAGIEYRVRHNNGTWRWHTSNAVTLVDSTGTAIGIEGIASDITVQKMAEDALHQIADRLQLATKVGGVGIWDYDVVKNELKWDDQMYRLYGITKHQFSGVYEAWRAGLLPEDQERCDKEIQMALAGEKDFDTEFCVRWPDRTVHCIRALALVQRDVSGRPLRMVGTNWDITARKHMEEALRESTERFKQLSEIFPETIFEADLDGKITYSNDHGLMLFELDASDIAKGVNIFDFIAPSDRQMVVSRVSESEDGKKGDFLEFRGMQKNGGTFDALAYTVPIMGNGHMIGFRGFILDISSRKRMEEALKQANAKLGILNSITRHDMLNQMTLLKGFLELCRQEGKGPLLVNYYDTMSRAADNLQKQIAFTKDYQDMGAKAPTWISVGRQTAEAFAMLHPPGAILEDATGGMEIRVDQLAARFPYNLIDNSIRHGEHVAHIKMSAEQRGDAVLIVYQDDGVGICVNEREHLFEKGFGKNTGLGLFLVREILAITGISIEEKGKAGQGVRFEILVPVGAWRRPPS